MTSWLALLFWVFAHSLWQAAILWLSYQGLRLLRPQLPSWSTSAVASLAVFSVPLLSLATAVALVSQSLAAGPGPEESGIPGIALPAVAWILMAATLGGRLLVAMWRSLRSESVSGTPRVIGWLRPLIVVPDAVASRLPEDQLAGIIAHEQEHVRAGDALVNLLQCWLDSLYFFNPAYRWLSRVAREEREFRCDDAAVRKVGTLVYLRALVEVARGAAIPQPCELTASGGLERRVARLAEAPTATGGRTELWLAGVAVLVFVLVLPCAATVPESHRHGASWQSRMVPVGVTVRNWAVPPLRAVGHALKKVAQ